jgi:hypothetical protein
MSCVFRVARSFPRQLRHSLVEVPSPISPVHCHDRFPRQPRRASLKLRHMPVICTALDCKPGLTFLRQRRRSLVEASVFVCRRRVRERFRGNFAAASSKAAHVLVVEQRQCVLAAASLKLYVGALRNSSRPRFHGNFAVASLKLAARSHAFAEQTKFPRQTSPRPRLSDAALETSTEPNHRSTCYGSFSPSSLAIASRVLRVIAASSPCAFSRIG